MNKLNQNTNLLKILAIIFMLIDHIGATFYPNLTILRCIGRLAFPLFFYSTFIGYFKTKNFKKYIFRLFVLAIISQLPYYLLFNRFTLNVCFALLLELLFLYLLDNKKYVEYIVLFTLSLLLVPILEYNIFILFLTPIFYYTKNTKLLFSISYVLFYLIMIGFGYDIIYLSCIILAPLLITNIKLNIKINKYFFYAFYPTHLLILYLIKVFF